MKKIICVIALFTVVNVKADALKNYSLSLINNDGKVVYEVQGGSAYGLPSHRYMNNNGVLVRTCKKIGNKTQSISKSEKYSTGYGSAIDLSHGIIELTSKSVDYSGYVKPDGTLECQNTGKPIQIKEIYSVSFDKESNELQEFNIDNKYKILLQLEDSV